MKVVIVGCGNVGAYIARDLHASGYDVLVIEKDIDIVARLQPTLEVEWLVGDACEFTTLQAANLFEADVTVAVTGDDEDNLVIALLSKQEFAVPRVVARVNHPQNEWLFNETWGVDVSVSTPHMLSALVKQAVSVGSFVRLLNLAGGGRIVEVTLAPDSPAAGRRISDLDIPRLATIVAVLRKQRLIVPRGDTILHAGDEIFALVMPESEEEVRQLLVSARPAIFQPERRLQVS